MCITDSIKKITLAALFGASFAGGAVSCTSTARDGSRVDFGQVSGRAEEADDESDDEAETPIAISDLPAAVREALARITSEDAVTQVTRDFEDGATTFDVEYTKDGSAWAVEFSPNGDVLENEPDGEDGEDDDGGRG